MFSLLYMWLTADTARCCVQLNTFSTPNSKLAHCTMQWDTAAWAAQTSCSSYQGLDMQIVICDARVVCTLHAETAMLQLRAHICKRNLVSTCMVCKAISVITKCSPRLTQHCWMHKWRVMQLTRHLTGITLLSPKSLPARSPPQLTNIS